MLAGIAVIALASPIDAVHATILTFDVAAQVRQRDPIPAQYGDNVVSLTQGGSSYGVGAEGFTPDVVVDYGAPGEDDRLWPTGFGDLVNVVFNDLDGDTTLTVRLSAASGFEVVLFDFDIASFTSTGNTIQGYSVRDNATGQSLFNSGSTFVPGPASTPVKHFDADFGGTPITAHDLSLVIDLTGLGQFSDNIGIDNIRFGQVAAAPTLPVPEPPTAAILGIAALAMGVRRRRRATESGSPSSFA